MADFGGKLFVKPDSKVKIFAHNVDELIWVVNVLELGLRRRRPNTVSVDQLHLNETIGKQANDHEDTGDAANHSFVRLVSFVC